MDWFFGFKLHLVVNEQGELLNAILTPSNVDDRQPVPQLLQQLFGKVFGVAKLFPQGVIGAMFPKNSHFSSGKTGVSN